MPSASPASAVQRLLLPLSAGISMLVVASLERDPVAAADTAYLALLATVSLLTIAHIAPRKDWIFAALALLVAAAVWALPGTPDRSAAVSALLVLGCSLAIVARKARSHELESGMVVVIFVALQLLMKSRQLLEPSAIDLLALLGWPLAAAIASLVLERHWGWASAALAAAMALLVGGGFNAVSTLGLVCLAAGTLLTAAAIGHLARLLAGLALLAPLLWDWRIGCLLVACGAACIERTATRMAIGSASLVAALLLREPTDQPLSALLILPLLLPALAIEPSRGRSLKAVALALAAATLMAGAEPAALAVPLSLLALATRYSSRSLVLIQGCWTGALAVGALLLATPPWLRVSPLLSVLGLFSLRVDWWSAILVLAAAALLWLYASRRPGSSSVWRALSPTLAITLVLAAALVAQLPRASEIVITKYDVTLTAENGWKHRLEATTTVSAIVIDSTLANSTAQPPGSVFGTLEARGPEGRSRWELRVGVDSGEWAALRPDVSSIDGFRAPSPHLSRVDASGAFFAQRYRTVLRLPEPTEISDLEIRLGPDVTNLSLSISHLELRR